MTPDLINTFVIAIIPLIGVVILVWGISRKHATRISLGAALLLLGLFVLLDKFPTYANTFNAWSTLLLAIAAFVTIQVTIWMEKRHAKESQAKQARNRQERLLKEIIDWAVNISKGGFDQDMDAFVTALESARQKELNLEEYKKYSSQIIGTNNYVIKVASDIDSDLSDSVNRLDSLLRKRFEMTIPYLQQRDTAVYLPFKNKLQIYELTNDIIEKAVRLL